VPVLVHDACRARSRICGQGPAPMRATIAHYRSEGLTSFPAPGCRVACPARSRPGCWCCATTVP
jgi:gamma-glutamyltranspeptidase/glutathione hydrolase